MTQSKEAKVLYYASPAAMIQSLCTDFLSLRLFAFLEIFFRFKAIDIIPTKQYA